MRKNLWEELKSESLTEAMRLCGCEKRYTDGTASDFECLFALLEALPMMRGHKAAAKAEETLSRLTRKSSSFEKLSAREMWLSFLSDENENSKTYLFDLHPNNSDEKYNIEDIEIEAVSLDAIALDARGLDEVILGALEALEGKNAAIAVAFDAEAFEKPNPYIANKRFGTCRKIEDNIIKSQILFEIASRRNTQKTQFIIDSRKGLKYAESLISYMLSHGLECRVFVCVDNESDIEKVLECCRLGDEKRLVTPLMIVSKNDNESDNEKFIRDLARVYPIGMLRGLRV